MARGAPFAPLGPPFEIDQERQRFEAARARLEADLAAGTINDEQYATAIAEEVRSPTEPR